MSTPSMMNERQRQLQSLAAASHTPDSWARALLASVVEDLSKRDGPLEDQTVQLTISVQPVRSTAATDEDHGHGIIEVCAGTEAHHVCIYWPPQLPIHF